MKDLVSKFLESSLDDFKGVAVVVNSKPLHVLAENDLRLVIITYSHDILEQGTTAASFIIALEAAMLSCSSDFGLQVPAIVHPRERNSAASMQQINGSLL